MYKFTSWHKLTQVDTSLQNQNLHVNLRMTTTNFELNQSQCKLSQVDTSPRKWVAKRNTKFQFMQVQN